MIISKIVFKIKYTILTTLTPGRHGTRFFFPGVITGVGLCVHRLGFFQKVLRLLIT